MKWASVIAVVFALLLAGCGGAANSQSSAQQTSSATSSSASSTASSSVRTMTIEASGGKEVKVNVEIADSPAEQEVGLMHRKSMGKDHGMLFVFPDSRIRYFWMKNTLIPLSIAYIGPDQRIINMLDMKPVREQTVSDFRLPRYASAKPAMYALEVNQGFFEEHGVEAGNKVRLPK